MARVLEYVTNGSFANGDTGWTLGTNYSVVNNEYLRWSSGSDTFDQSSQTITVPTHTILEIRFDYWGSMTDTTLVTGATAAGGLNNARFIIQDADGNQLAIMYTGVTNNVWEKRGCLFSSPKGTIKLVFIGRRAGDIRWKNISIRKFTGCRLGPRRAPALGLPSFKGGNLDTFLSSAGAGIGNSWLSAANYTSGNKAEWAGLFNSMYLANKLQVCRIFIQVAGNYDDAENLFNSDWTGLNATESANLRDFFTNVIPAGLKVVPVLTGHGDIPDSIYNTSLTPDPAHHTQDNFMARIAEVITILNDYKSKIAMWEIINEPNLNIGTEVTAAMIKTLLGRFYTAVKAVDITVPVSTSHQDQNWYHYDHLLVGGTTDVIQYHAYGVTPIIGASGGMLNVMPEYMNYPCVMGEGRHVDGGNDAVINAPYLQIANDLYYALGFEGFWPWTIKGYSDGNNGSSALDMGWTDASARRVVGVVTESLE